MDLLPHPLLRMSRAAQRARWPIAPASELARTLARAPQLTVSMPDRPREGEDCTPRFVRRVAGPSQRTGLKL